MGIFTFERFHPTASQVVKFGTSLGAFCLLKAAFTNGKAEDRLSKPESCSALYCAIHRLGSFNMMEVRNDPLLMVRAEMKLIMELKFS